jgi:cardiolipin synthase
MFGHNWKKEIFTIPNLMSLFRILLIPVYISIYVHATEPKHYLIAGFILSVSCLTDWVDGRIARRFGQISTLGKILDPVADKATQFTLTVCLAIRHPVLWNLAGLFVLKEGFQLIAGIIEFRKGKMLTGALLTGKICTTVLFVSLIALVLLPQIPQTVVAIITVIDGIFMLIAFGHYIFTYSKKTSKIQNIEDHEDRKR